MDAKILIAALFLPLFPLSMLFNVFFETLRGPFQRFVVLLVWPQIGLWLAKDSAASMPEWVVYLALATSLLYGFRALVIRELTLWISFLATSTWALLWVLMGFSDSYATLSLLAFGFSIPLGILALLGGHLEAEFGSSYAGLYNGLGHSMPRFSGLLVFTMLAIIATPVFPGFTTITMAFMQAMKTGIGSIVLLSLIFLMWAWSGARLVQGFVIGEDNREGVHDLSSGAAWLYTALLTGLAVFGINLISRLS